MPNRLATVTALQAQRIPDREAYRFCWRKGGEWLSTSYLEFESQVEVAARALAALGAKPLERIAVCSPNTPQILITEFGAFRNRLSSIPIYASSSQAQFDFIVRNGDARIIFVGDKHQYPLAYNYWKAHSSQVSRIVVFKNDELELRPDDKVTIFWDDFIRLGMGKDADRLQEEVRRRTDAGEPEDMATLIYTSGTTGEPKGVVISHSNYDFAMQAHLELLTCLKDTDVSMSFLPMSHILEKAWCFFCVTRGLAIAVNYDPRMIQETIHEVHPNLMTTVPRFWEKVYTAVKEKIATMNSLQRLAVRRALNVGRRRNLHYRRLGLRVPWLLEKEYAFWDRRVFSRLKHAIGIPQPNMFPTAGAPISDRIVEFMRSVGIDLVIGYGLSETTATVSCFRETGYEIGTVGKPLPGIDVKIDGSGEILVKAPSVTPGYYRNPEANKAAFTEDGFFRTGDAGYLTDDGAIVLTERVKDLFKTSNGKYIAPQQLESMLVENKYIDEVAVIGEGKKYVSALVVPNIPHLSAWARENRIPYRDTAELCANPRVVDFVFGQIARMQAGLAPYEQIKRITLLPHSFSVMNGEVTNTMKVRRPVVARNYASQIAAMYDD